VNQSLDHSGLIGESHVKPSHASPSPVAIVTPVTAATARATRRAPTTNRPSDSHSQATAPAAFNPPDRSKLDWAIAHARRGFPVFPLMANSKRPPAEMDNWPYRATIDETQIQNWWGRWPNANIACFTGSLFVVDIDPRNGGKETFEALMLAEDFPKTLISKTAGGGNHLFYALPPHTTVQKGKLGAGIDVQSWGAYVVLPGSTIDGKTYEWMNDRPLAQVPQWMIDQCKKRAERSPDAGKRLVDEDETGKELAWSWIKNYAPEVNEGGRNNACVAVANRMFDYGLELLTALDFVCQWSEARCHPPLDVEEIRTTVDSAMHTRQATIGCAHPLAPGFEPMDIGDGVVASAPESLSQNLATNNRAYEAVAMNETLETDYEAARLYVTTDAPEVVDNSRTRNEAMAALSTVLETLLSFRLSWQEMEELSNIWNARACNPPFPAADLRAVVADELAWRDKQAQQPKSRNAAAPDTPRIANSSQEDGSVADAPQIVPTNSAASGAATRATDTGTRSNAQTESSLRDQRPPLTKEPLHGKAPPIVISATPLRRFDPATIPPVPWIVRGLAARRAISTLTGPSGLSKSTWTLQLAVAVAAGRSDICGYELATPERVWVWSQEDDISQMELRIAAIMQAFGVTHDNMCEEDGTRRLYLDSGLGQGKHLTLVKRAGETLRESEQFAAMLAEARRLRPGLIVLDPLISLHQAAENDNVQMRAVFDCISQIAVEADSAVLIVSHTGKPDKGSSKGFAGDSYASRGASAQPDAARVAVTFMGLSEDDAKKGWRLPAGKSHLDYVRIDDSKSNLGKKRREPRLLAREDVLVTGFTGDSMEVLRPVVLDTRTKASAPDIANNIAKALAENLAPDKAHPLSDVLSHLPEAEAALLRDQKNRGRHLDAAFYGAGVLECLTDFGKLTRITRRGKQGTLLRLSPAAAIPQIPQNKDEELASG
jgi:Bifunctional DNA primase/polymerase, N-terminal/AAA domain/Primase C terminal 1 (PriCT-1)